jgi:C1A family cysteine protease
MANLKAFGIVLLVGALTTYLVIRHNGHVHKPDPKTLNTLFNSWKSQHGFKFSAAEESVRQALFQKTSQLVNEHNAKPNKSFELGLNQFSAYSDEEFAALFLGELKGVQDNQTQVVTLNTTLLKETPSFDWTTKGAVTPIKNQGSCGSCWAFSATGALEGLRFVSKGDLPAFSEQHLLDCSGSYGNLGCNGGLAYYAFNYVKANGIVKGSEYPYTAKQGACSIPASAEKFKISGWAQVPKGDLAQMQTALSNQPLAVSVQADSAVFRNYKSGILDDASCGTALNHAILAVGYETGKYWKVKNSWGTAWGTDGYILIAMKGDLGICGINQRVTYPIA